MHIDEHIEAFILAAESKALATYGSSLNVVPVSSVKVVNGNIWLVNYFLDKTLANIQTNTSVAFVCWKQMMGYQIKGSVAYTTEGADFDAAVQWIKEILPERVVQGLLVLTPEYIYDISPTKDTKEKFGV